MKRTRFIKYDFQPCIYYWRMKNRFAILIVYVDDILIATNDKEKLKEIKTQLNHEFETSDLGEVKKFLGIVKLSEIEKIELRLFTNKKWLEP